MDVDVRVWALRPHVQKLTPVPAKGVAAGRTSSAADEVPSAAASRSGPARAGGGVEVGTTPTTSSASASALASDVLMTSRCLIVEASDGVLYRRKATTTESGTSNVQQEACVSGLAAVATDSFFRPAVGRGIRGAAGTGRGVATVIDGLSLAYRNDDFDDGLHHEVGPGWWHEKLAPHTAPHNSPPDPSLISQVAVELPLSLDRTVRASGASLDRAPIVVRPVSEPPPVAVCPPLQPSRDMGRRVTELVGSYEEILFVVNAVAGFIGPDLNAPEVLEGGGGGGGSGSGGSGSGAERHALVPGDGRDGSDVPPPPPPPPTDLLSPAPPHPRSMFRRRSSLMAGSWGGRKGSIRMPVARGSSAKVGAAAGAGSIHVDTGSPSESEDEGDIKIEDGDEGTRHGSATGRAPSPRHRRQTSGDSCSSSASSSSASSSTSSSLSAGVDALGNRLSLGDRRPGVEDELVSFEVLLRVQGLRFVLLDNLLGLHLPVVQGLLRHRKRPFPNPTPPPTPILTQSSTETGWYLVTSGGHPPHHTHAPTLAANISEIGCSFASLVDYEGSLKETCNLPFDQDLDSRHGLGGAAEDDGLRRGRGRESRGGGDGTGGDGVRGVAASSGGTIASGVAGASTSGVVAVAGGVGTSTSSTKLGRALNLSSTICLSADYFNSPLRCWEPLLEPFECSVSLEQCLERGRCVVGVVVVGQGRYGTAGVACRWLR